MKKLRVPEIDLTHQDLLKAEKKAHKSRTHPKNKKRRTIVFFTSILLIVIGNVLVATTIVPFLLSLNILFFDSIVMVIALLIGFLYSFLFLNMAHLEKSHHVLASVLVPLIAIFNLILSFQIVGFEKQNMIRILLVSAAYGFFFIIPYIIDISTIKRNKKPFLAR